MPTRYVLADDLTRLTRREWGELLQLPPAPWTLSMGKPHTSGYWQEKPRPACEAGAISHRTGRSVIAALNGDCLPMFASAQTRGNWLRKFALHILAAECG
jgi:hypothetical protein